MDYDGYTLIIRVENPTGSVPIAADSGFISSEELPGHGIGLVIIEAIAQQYDGHLSIQNENGCFKLMVILQEICRY